MLSGKIFQVLANAHYGYEPAEIDVVEKLLLIDTFVQLCSCFISAAQHLETNDLDSNNREIKSHMMT